MSIFFTIDLEQWCQTDPVKGHVAAGFHSNQARTHLIWIRCVLVLENIVKIIGGSIDNEIS